MEMFQGLFLGFQHAFEVHNIMYCFIGAFFGTFIGVLPGLGPVGAMAILLPITFNAPGLGSLIMLAGLYYGAMYGGSTTSILMNIPGETASVMTCIDGYQMALQGRAGPALGISAFGSFIAGTFGLFGLTLIAVPLTNIALMFGPPEYFSLMILGLIILVYIAQKSFIKALSMGAFGLLLSYVGLDIVSGVARFTFDIDPLLEGLGLVPTLIGLFGMPEILENLEKEVKGSLLKSKIKNILPDKKDWSRSIGPILRGSVIGFCVGILPGMGPALSTFVSYAAEKRIAKDRTIFGKGAIEGVASAESANNGASSGNFVPLLTLGIPANPIMAMLFAGFMIHNITPGPLFIKEHPHVFWGLIASMYLGNVILLFLNLPLIRMWVQVTKIPFRYLFPCIIILCLVGVYSMNNSIFDIWVMVIFSVIGYTMKKCDYEPAPLVLAFVLGPMIEQALRQSLIMSNGNFSIFFTRPISALCMSIGSLLLIMAVISTFLKKKPSIISED